VRAGVLAGGSVLALLGASASSKAAGSHAPPVVMSRPEIWGLPRSGASLRTLTIGSWRGAGKRVRYQWQRSDARGRWRNIARAHRRVYWLSTADVGTRVRLLVTVSNHGRSRAAASDATKRVAPGAPINTAPPPAPTGTPVVGAVLIAQPGSWYPPTAPVPANQPGASTASKTSTTPKTSTPSTASKTSTPSTTPTASKTSTARTIATPPTTATASVIDVWLRCAPQAQAISRACSQIGMGATYTVAPADLGYRIGVRVNATSAAITRSANSMLTDVVTSAAVSLGGVARTVPTSFLGLSMETNEFASFDNNVPAFASLLRLLQTGDGPVALRIGGQSADTTYWTPGFTVPAHAITIDSTYMQNLGQLAGEVPLSVMFDLNLAAHSPSMAETHSPSMAETVATAAVNALPAGALSALEVGNEPDLYRTLTFPNQPWAANYGPSNYAIDYSSYAPALASAAPGVPLAGPSLAGLGQDWFGALLTADRPNVGLLTGHRYPFSACATPGTPQYPSITGQLSNQAAAGLANSARAAVATAHQAGLPFRLDELGSASCTGIYGVSDTFATVLWASDVLFNMLAVGVDGVNVHTRYNTSNTPIWGAGTPRIRPFFYGLVVFARTLGPGAELVQTAITGQLPTGLSVWPVRVQGDQEHVLVINKASSPSTVTLEAGARDSAQVRLLQSSSMAPGAQVTFGGQRIADDGTWQGTPVTSTLDAHDGAYDVTAPPLSASLLTFPAAS
jgi:hypothetical protein